MSVETNGCSRENDVIIINYIIRELSDAPKIRTCEPEKSVIFKLELFGGRRGEVTCLLRAQMTKASGLVCGCRHPIQVVAWYRSERGCRLLLCVSDFQIKQFKAAV